MGNVTASSLYDAADTTVVFNRSKRSRYRGNLSHGIYITYRQALTRTIAMIIRFIHAHENGNKRGFGRFVLKGDLKQAQAALDLYSLIIKTRGHPEKSELMTSAHALFDALLRPKTLSEDKLACPTDQMIFLVSILAGGRFRTARTTVNYCSGLQFCFRCIMIHIARLDCIGSDRYVPWRRDGQVSGSDTDGSNVTRSGCAQEENTDVDCVSSSSGSDLPGSEAEARSAGIGTREPDCFYDSIVDSGK
jgi:hypothetical protein